MSLDATILLRGGGSEVGFTLSFQQKVHQKNAISHIGALLQMSMTYLDFDDERADDMRTLKGYMKSLEHIQNGLNKIQKKAKKKASPPALPCILSSEHDHIGKDESKSEELDQAVKFPAESPGEIAESLVQCAENSAERARLSNSGAQWQDSQDQDSELASSSGSPPARAVGGRPPRPAGPSADARIPFAQRPALRSNSPRPAAQRGASPDASNASAPEVKPQHRAPPLQPRSASPQEECSPDTGAKRSLQEPCQEDPCCASPRVGTGPFAPSHPKEAKAKAESFLTRLRFRPKSMSASGSSTPSTPSFCPPDVVGK